VWRARRACSSAMRASFSRPLSSSWASACSSAATCTTRQSQGEGEQCEPPCIQTRDLHRQQRPTSCSLIPPTALACDHTHLFVQLCLRQRWRVLWKTRHRDSRFNSEIMFVADRTAANGVGDRVNASATCRHRRIRRFCRGAARRMRRGASKCRTSRCTHTGGGAAAAPASDPRRVYACRACGLWR